MSEGRRTQVLLLDERRLDIVVQPRLFVSELLNIVASHCQLKDPDKQYFGLAFYDDKQQCHWLQNERRVLDHEFPRKYAVTGATLLVYHLPKFYVESITQLAHASCVELMFLQARHLLYRGFLETDSEAIFQLGATAMQIYFGDFTNANAAKNNMKRLPLFPAKLLKEQFSLSQCEDRVVELYESMCGVSKGQALVSFMTVIERLHTYGVHAYEVKDKAGTSMILGISSRGIYQYDLNCMDKPRKGFHWKQLENLYYRDRKFSIEVHDPKRVMHTLSSFNLYEDVIQEPADQYDDLTEAVCDPTTQVSVSRRAFVPSNVYVHVFWCETAQLCKTIWSLAIAQHEFYLDKRAAAKKGTQFVFHTPRELAEKLDNCASLLGGSLTMRSGGDAGSSDLGSSVSSHSLHSIPSTGSTERSEEEKLKEIDLYKQLKARKTELEERLVQKMKELKEACIREGEISGELSVDIRRALTPGEAEPKIKRRVGTAFTITTETMSKHRKADQIAKLEADVEIHRKIVAAALKLASDSTTNKSVRRKRRRDYDAARQKLRELEQRLHQLRLSSSKPDLPNVHLDAGISAFNTLSRVSKSLPNTPRGSMPDLSENTSNNYVEDGTNVEKPLQQQQQQQRLSAFGKPPLAPVVSSRPPNLPLPPMSPRKRLQQQLGIGKGLQHSSSFPNETRPVAPAARQDFICNPNDLLNIQSENASGYRSHTAYQSSYRTQNFPTLCGASTTSIGYRTDSNHSLQSNASSSSPTVPLVSDILRSGDMVDHSIGAYNIPHQRTSWNNECLTQLNTAPAAVLGSSESLNIGVQPYADHVSVNVSPIKSTFFGSKLNRFKTNCANGQPSADTSSHCYTGSLDRRLLKQRQREKWRPQLISNAFNNNSSAQSPARIECLERSPTRYGMAAQKHSNSFKTPVSPRFVHKLLSNPKNYVETTKPYETADFIKYSSGHAHQQQQPVQRSLSQTSSNGDPQNVQRFGCPKKADRWWTAQVQARQNGPNLPSKSQAVETTSTDALAWYDDRDPNRKKTATIV